MVLVLRTGSDHWFQHLPAAICSARVIPRDHIFHEEQGIDLAPQSCHRTSTRMKRYILLCTNQSTYREESHRQQLEIFRCSSTRFLWSSWCAVERKNVNRGYPWLPWRVDGNTRHPEIARAPLPNHFGVPNSWTFPVDEYSSCVAGKNEWQSVPQTVGHQISGCLKHLKRRLSNRLWMRYTPKIIQNRTPTTWGIRTQNEEGSKLQNKYIGWCHFGYTESASFCPKGRMDLICRSRGGCVPKTHQLATGKGGNKDLVFARLDSCTVILNSLE